MVTQFPNPSGKYSVSCVDVLPDYGRDTFLLRVYYPTPNFTPSLENLAPWAKEDEYIYGYSRFQGLSIVNFLFNNLLKGQKVPVLWEGPMLSSVASFPVILFSHGLGGNRTCNSYNCFELASHGFIVAALEHRDLSTSATYFLDKDENGTVEKEWMYMILADKTNPATQILRNMQVQKRAKEASKCLDYLEELNNGTLKNVISDFDLLIFKNKMDLNQISMVGHSFGAATTLLTAKNDPRIKVVCVLDPWMIPIDIKITNCVYGDAFTQPLLIIDSEHFQSSHTLSCLDQIRVSGSLQKRQLKFIGSVHQTFADFCFFLPGTIGKWFEITGPLDSVLANRIITELMLKFIGNAFDLPTAGNIDDIIKEHDFIVDELADMSESNGISGTDNKND